MDLETKIIGHRVWSVQDNGYLHAIGRPDQAWGRGTNEARCNRRDYYGGRGLLSMSLSIRYGTDPAEAPQEPCKDAPGHNCECGLYAYHDYDGNPSRGPFVSPATHIPGVIRAWGRMEVHNKGFRAQYAEILALGFNPNWTRSSVDRVKAVARDYEVEALPLDRLVAFGSELGQIIPNADRPKITPPQSAPALQAIKPGEAGLVPAASAFDRAYAATLDDLRKTTARQLGSQLAASQFAIPIKKGHPA